MAFSKPNRAFIWAFFLTLALPLGKMWAFSDDHSLSNNSFRMRMDEPLMVSNKLLPPGTYIWKRLDSLSNHNIVQISNEATHHVEATVIAIPNSREEPADANELDYWETPKGYPRAVRAWFLPGETFGQEFPYPTKMAMVLPRRMPSLQSRPGAESGEQQSRALQSSVESSHKVQAAANANAVGSNFPPGSWAIITDGYPATTNSVKQVGNKRAGSIWDTIRKLPLTATIAPLIGLVGLISIALFFLSHGRKTKLRD